jgi:hypothetical protein
MEAAANERRSETAETVSPVGPGAYKYLGFSNLELVAQIFPRWNPLTSWMRQIEGFKRAA